jgi:hypothetical protein
MHTTQLSAKEAIFISAIQELSAEVNTLQAQISGSSNFSTLKTAVTGT